MGNLAARLAPKGLYPRWSILLPLIGLAVLMAVFVPRQPKPDWEPAIRAFEAQDRRQRPQPGQVVFVGSSSIRFWHTLTADMAPVSVLNRGFGGARLCDMLRYSDRIILPYQPRAVVIYAGENDLASWWAWSGLVVDRFQRLVAHLRQRDPTLPILVLAMKPSPRFAARLKRQQEANRQLRAYCEATPGLFFVDVASPLLGADGQPRPELFRDGLHLNAAGYRLWRERVQPALLAMLGLSSEFAESGTAAPAPRAPAPPPSSAPAPRASSLPPSP